eukprot:TRINITY_DN602_c0_g2_i2.p1 TRINITY_DN602_c0_g2~~TRINITY_DN602_c0_g2_i2.p1  ORF type:complete len:486 (-),score=100.63 TRINITY_DN602_c0_g2_i2:183-1532(-)
MAETTEPTPIASESKAVALTTAPDAAPPAGEAVSARDTVAAKTTTVTAVEASSAAAESPSVTEDAAHAPPLTTQDPVGDDLPPSTGSQDPPSQPHAALHVLPQSFPAPPSTTAEAAPAETERETPQKSVPTADASTPEVPATSPSTAATAVSTIPTSAAVPASVSSVTSAAATVPTAIGSATVTSVTASATPVVSAVSATSTSVAATAAVSTASTTTAAVVTATGSATSTSGAVTTSVSTTSTGAVTTPSPKPAPLVIPTTSSTAPTTNTMSPAKPLTPTSPMSTDRRTSLSVDDVKLKPRLSSVYQKSAMTLQAAVNSGMLNEVKFSLESLAPEVLASAPQDKMTPLHSAILRGMTPIAVEIIGNPHINIDIEDAQGWTPLHHASLLGYADVVAKLLDKTHPLPRLDLAANGEPKCTPLKLARSKKHTKLAELLLAAGAQNDGCCTLM